MTLLPRRTLLIAGLGLTVVALLAAAVVSASVVATEGDAGSSPTTVAPIATTTTTAAVVASTSTSPAPPGVVAALEEIWRATPGGCLRVTAGISVIYDANGSREVAPASVTKVFTAAAALEVLGPDARLETTVETMSPAVDGVVRGDIWLVGGGDPVLGTDAWAAQLADDRRLYTSLDTLADRVVAAGLRRIEGRVLGDESRYDSARYVDTWPARLVDDGEAGPLSALTVNDGFRIWGHPGVPFVNPPADAAALFRELLIARGITVVGGGDAGERPQDAERIASAASPTVRELVHAMLSDSDNGTAELLVKEIGWRSRRVGSTAAGSAAIEELLGRLKIPTAGVVVADGSGLSTAARLTCNAMTAFLDRMADDLPHLLAVGGRDGTLATRFRGSPAEGRIRAKTGSLNGMAALAGYADTAAGRVVFAYVATDLPNGTSNRQLQDALAVVLVTTQWQ
ncbi:MAG: D-alanyl-D-alanine carboxypeptidase/D-alanyl-D-alanine-endopeptidase [Acidimicrobiia bacterium]